MSFSTPLIWFLAGVIFLIVEIIMPAFMLIFFTVGCWITALVVLIFDIEITNQILIFIAASLTLLFTLRKYSLKIFRGKIRDDIDEQCTDSNIGKTAIVTRKITPNMYGEIKAMGSFWRATANEEIEKGASVLIEERKSDEGLVFKVKHL